MGTIKNIIQLLSICCCLLTFVGAQTEEEMKILLEDYDRETSLLCNRNQNASWNVQIDVLNEEKVAFQNAVILEYAAFRKKYYDENFKNADINSYTDPDVRRKLEILQNIGTAILDDNDLTELNAARNRMSRIYNNAKICPFNQQNCNLESDIALTLDPHIDLLLGSSTDYDEMKWIWEQWHEKSGKLMREDYQIYVDLMNKAAVANLYEDAGDMWRARYEEDLFIQIVDKLWDDVSPLYNELHKYVYNELKYLYGPKMDTKNKNLPAHLMGNMWAQNWVNLYDRIKPFKNASQIDVTKTMENQNFTVMKMFEMSDDFYKSLGLPPSDMSYSEKAVIEKPEQVIACHASAWDFCDGEDFRIKMCTKVNMEDFTTVHHEMGHIMYYLMYKEQPLLYRTGANPGFHEAVGDTIALSVATPQHLQVVNLLEKYDDTKEDNINSLFRMALERVAFLPFGLLIDKWRWDVFSGEVREEEWNEHWWKLREQYQKISPPSSRGEEFFDPGAKYHVPADSQYIAYFVAHIIEFSFYKSLCIAAGQYDPANPSVRPLHKCDFYQSQAAGEKLRAGLQLGYSKHWSEALNELTGNPQITADALLEYFQPLYDFLKEQNEMSDILDRYNEEAAVVWNKLVKAEWDVATDSGNEEKTAEHARVVLESAEFTRKFHEDHFKNVSPSDFTNELNQRQLKYLSKLGTDALDNTKLKELTDTINTISGIYDTARICPYSKQSCNLDTEGLTLDPDISQVMSTSDNYDELKWTWEQWHEKSGKLMRGGYKTYVSLVNEAAALNGYTDNGERWRDSYEDSNFVDNVDNMWIQIKPLYDELHTYVRRKLQKLYPNQIDKNSETIPAHLLGNMWAQSWVNLYEKVKPFTNGSLIDIDEKLKKEMNILQMFQESDRFFKELGLEPNDMSYNETRGAVIQKPTDRTITCHASAWDFYEGDDFRIKMCTSINQEDFITVHHEMGHIQYFILYKHLPLVLRTGANPGFHEAVGDLIALSVSTPTHLKKINLLDNYADTKEDNINVLFKMALERVAFMPFGLLIDKWRWDVFSGEVKDDKWNEHWWRLREQYQKVSPPSTRGEEFFDPGAKFHIPADSQYIAYFIAHMLEFQMHRAVCIEAGQYDPTKPDQMPLHKCDIDQSLAAGKKIRAGLELGLSKHWSEALKEMTGEDKIDGSAVLEYFKPLYDYLKEENENYDDSDAVAHFIPALTIAIGAFVSIITTFVRF